MSVVCGRDQGRGPATEEGAASAALSAGTWTAVVKVRVNARIQLVANVGTVGAVVGGTLIRAAMIIVRVDSRIQLVSNIGAVWARVY